jgi:hypothetical protein
MYSRRSTSVSFSSFVVFAALAMLVIAGAGSAQIVGFGGSTMTGWTPNGNTGGVPSVSGSGTAADVLTITTAANSISSSYWNNTPQNITNFVESFTYQEASGAPADGVVFAWQNQGTGAIGGGGGQLGFTGITQAAGLAINIYGGNPVGSGYNRTVSAGNPAAQSAPPAPNNVNVASGHPINVTLSYKESDGALTETMTDTVAATTYTRVWRGISIQGQVGAPTAFVGITGATGGLNANQTITNFRFTPGTAVSLPPTIAPIAVTGWNQNMIISAANGSSNITATMDGGTGKTGDTFFEIGTDTPANHPGGGATAAGVPGPGTFGSVNDAQHGFQLQPNGAGQNDAVMLDAPGSATLTLTSPSKYSALSFLVASGNGAGTINVTIHYADGSTQNAGVASPDWFNNGPIAWYAGGRVDVAFDDWNQELTNNPRMFQEDVNLNNIASNVTSIDFAYNNDGNREVVFAVSGTAVPEPSTIGLLSAAAAAWLVRRRRSK